MSLLFLDWSFSLLLVFSSALVLFFFRELSISPLVEASAGESIFLAPITGSVWRIRENIQHEYFGNNLKEIVLIKPYFTEMGLRLPLHCESIKLKYRRPKPVLHTFLPKDFCRDQSYENYGGACQGLRSYLGVEFGLQIIPTLLSARPRIFLEAGDKGKQGGVFGYMPFGGVVNLYVSDETEVLVKKGDRVVVCETPLCGSPKAMG